MTSAYLDHAATTPMRPEAIAAMAEELERFGNPSSLHAAGRRARRVVEESREQIAEVFGARPSEVVFTSGGTEADNLAVKGLFWARTAAAGGPGQFGAAAGGPGQFGTAPTAPAAPAIRSRVVTTSVEHHAVLD
jgi:cysteine sulfinate desulfinase/cysteine desulfurase-like protein